MLYITEAKVRKNINNEWTCFSNIVILIYKQPLLVLYFPEIYFASALYIAFKVVRSFVFSLKLFIVRDVNTVQLGLLDIKCLTTKASYLYSQLYRDVFLVSELSKCYHYTLCTAPHVNMSDTERINTFTTFNKSEKVSSSQANFVIIR